MLDKRSLEGKSYQLLKIHFWWNNTKESKGDGKWKVPRNHCEYLGSTFLASDRLAYPEKPVSLTP